MEDQSKIQYNRAWLTISALGSILVSYLVYKQVNVNEDKINRAKQQRRRERSQNRASSEGRRLQHRGQRDKSDEAGERIVGANQRFAPNDELTQEEQEELKIERMEQDLKNAATGTKTIYFDSNDNMYTEEEVLKGNIKKKRNLTKMKVRVPEQDRKRLNEVKTTQTKQCLDEFLNQINQTKQKYVKERRGGNKAHSSGMRLGLGSELTTSSGTVSSLSRIKLEPRHFKSKQGTVWLNMFETISNNYCLANDKNGKAKG